MLVISYAVGKGAIAEFYQSAYIDFAVWVLRHDGLDVAPFDLHERGFGNLRIAGMTKDSWLEWFRRLVATQHTGFRLRRDGVLPFLKRRRMELSYVPIIMDGTLETATAPNPDAEPILEKLYDCILRLSPIPGGAANDRLEDFCSLDLLPASSPVDSWQGSESVKAELARSWEQYRTDPAERVYHASDIHRAMARSHRFAAEIDLAIRKALCEEERFLMFNFVNYSEKVILPVGSSVVIGLPKQFPVEEIQPVLVEAVKAALTYCS